METPEFSIEWYKQNLPEGVTVNERLTKLYSPGVMLVDINTDEYPTLLSQMGIINYIELALTNPAVEIQYSIDHFQYRSAYKFRLDNGYDNKFFL